MLSVYLSFTCRLLLSICNMMGFCLLFKVCPLCLCYYFCLLLVCLSEVSLFLVCLLPVGLMFIYFLHVCMPIFSCLSSFCQFVCCLSVICLYVVGFPIIPLFAGISVLWTFLLEFHLLVSVSLFTLLYCYRYIGAVCMLHVFCLPSEYYIYISVSVLALCSNFVYTSLTSSVYTCA